jgi:hypothetical protein
MDVTPLAVADRAEQPADGFRGPPPTGQVPERLGELAGLGAVTNPYRRGFNGDGCVTAAAGVVD